MNRNIAEVFFTKAIRTTSYGFMAVLLPVYLARVGLSKQALGLTFSLTLAASALITWFVIPLTRRWGTRRVLVGLHAITVTSGILFLYGERLSALVAGAMIGNLAVGVGETGPFLALEQVLIARSASSHTLTRSLSLYNLLGYLCAALGGFFVGRLQNPRLFFLLFIFSGVVQSLVYFFSKDAPVKASVQSDGMATATPLIRKIAALFALDAFGGGFILQSWVVYWFYLRFGLDLPALGGVYFITQTATGLSLLAAAPLSRWMGLVNAMVFSHLLSNVFLIAVAMAPTARVAIGLLIGRHLLSQIDVPTRQSFLMLAVPDEERERASNFTTMSRTFSQAVSPAFTGWLMQAISLSAPFVFGGGLKIFYDFLLYRTVKNIPLAGLDAKGA